MEQLMKQSDSVSLEYHFVEHINHIAKQAGALILDVYKQDFAVKSKIDQSPLTEADLASHNFIVSQLSDLTPNIPILSEESADIDWQTRSSWDEYWLIDPLDGTKEFIKRNGEFTVNIALIKNQEPVLGVVYAPVLNLLYFASAEIGAFKQEVTSAALPIVAAGLPKNRAYKIMGSRSHQTDAFKGYIKEFESPDIMAMGSSLKICYVAEGKADIYPRLGPTMEWDTAAADAIVRQAGGQCINYETKQNLVYNSKDSLLNPFFIIQGF